MTCIAFDGYDLACDGRADNHGMIVTDTCNKIYEIPEGWIGCAGGDGDIEVVIDWLNSGGSYETRPTRKTKSDKIKFEGILVNRKGECICLDGDLIRVPYDAPQAAGSGWVPAQTAMHLGATARQAVEVACKMNAFCGGKITVVNVIPRKEKKIGKSKNTLP